MANIITKIESARGCGYKKEGGMYLTSSGLSKPCYKFPIALTVCPCCSAGIKPTRGFTWISFDLIKNAPCSKSDCFGCYPFDGSHDRFGLLWIGEKFYKTPEDFTREARSLGVSRRLSQIPRDLEIGKTWILIAHRKAIKTEDPDNPFAPGIFHAFKPERIEYVITGKETEKELERLEKRGFTLVKIIKDTETQYSLV